MAGGLQEKERAVSGDDTIAKFSTGLGSTHKQEYFKKVITLE